MAWCPKCENEYRKGITVCADCGCELVEEDRSKKQEAVIIEEEKHIQSIKEFMEQQSEEENITARVMVPGGAYLNSAQKAEDNRSSAWTLLLIGGVGIIVMILGIFNVLPFHVGNPYLFYGVMSAVFILFIVMGFVSMKNAKFFAKNVESEKSLKNSLLEWCEQNLRADQIDAKIQYAEEIAYEELCLRRFEVIKHMINYQFMNLDQNFVDRLIDDEVYDMVFPSEDV